MKFLAGAAFGAFLLAPAALSAQTAPAQPQPGAAAGATASASAAPTVGATVYDSTGAVLGTVEQVTPQAVVVNIGSAKVGLPPTSIGSGPQGLRVATTKAEIETQAKGAAQQQLATQLVAGATVSGTGGARIGTVKTIEGEFVTVTTAKGDVRLPRTGFAAGPNGPVVGLTAAQLDAAIGQSGGTSTAGAGTTTQGQAGGQADTAETGTSAGAATGTAAGSSSVGDRSGTAKKPPRR